MRKNSIAIISLAFLASCFMVSCSTEAFDTNQPVKGAKIVIPAQKMSTKAVNAAGKATFKTSEVVYICKGTTIDAGELQPANNGPSADITGTLQESYSVDDEITVLYNTDNSGVVDYSGQDGSIESVKDAGCANVKIVSYSGSVLTTTQANIANLQSIFKFSFTNNSSSISGIRSVQISSKDGKLFSSYDVLTPKNSTYGNVTVSSTTDLTDVYAALRFDGNDGDVISFEVVDNAGNVYQGSKNAPSGGFVNGNFYTASVDVNPVYKTLSALKAAINNVDDITSLSNSFIGKYIDKDGNIHDTQESGDIGIIAYLSKSNIPWYGNMTSAYGNALSSQSDISFSETRMLVLALTDFTATWNSLVNGFTYDVLRPTGSTKWFVPSRWQMRELMGITSPRAGAAAKISFSSGYYWSCSKDSSTKAYCFNSGTNGWTYRDMTSNYFVLPCFAY